MIKPDRRKILQFLALAALAPAAVPRSAAAAMPGGLIAPPTTAMRFRREVIRGAFDKSQICVVREFEVRFSRFADGFIVDGHQVSAEVSGPPGLAAFAALERARVETGLFPLVLDPFGQISTEEPSAARGGQVEQAFELAIQHITDQTLEPLDRDELSQFVTAMHQAGESIIAYMPVDLFAPATTARAESRDIALPTGDIGRLVSSFNGERDASTGLMSRAMREVLTQIDGDQRRTTEQWQLIPS